MFLVQLQGEFAKEMEVQLLSKPRDDASTEVVGTALLYGMPGDLHHCVPLEDDEFSVQVKDSFKDEHELQFPVSDKNLFTLSQAIGWIIRWPATDLRRLSSKVQRAPGPVGATINQTAAACDSNAAAATTREGRATTRAGAKKGKSPEKQKAKSPVKKKTKEDTKKPKKVAFNPAAEVNTVTTFLLYDSSDLTWFHAVKHVCHPRRSCTLRALQNQGRCILIRWSGF